MRISDWSSDVCSSDLFNREGRVLRVLLQAEAAARMTPQDILNLRVRNAEGQMVPFSAFTEVSWEAGPPSVQRYNGYPAMTISGNAAPGYSSGEIGRAHVCTPVTNAHLVCRLLLETKQPNKTK